MPDPTAVSNALLAGQLDYAGLQSADARAQFPEGQFTTGTNNPTAVGALFIVDREGAMVPALADERVRRAINLAIDREGIAENLNPGTNHPTNQIFSPEGEAFSEELLEETPYDVEEAKELMAEAGYADGFTVTMPSTVVSTAYESAITQSLSDIGIEVTWESVPFQDFYAKVFGGNYAMFFMFNGFGGADAMDFKAAQSGVFNPFSTTTPELEALVAAADSAPEEEQGEAFRAVNEYLVDEAWYAPISYVTGFYAVPTTVDYTPPVVFGQSVLPFAPAESN
jgi:peptide/nickel transport system substrate-binding protein